MKHSVLSPVSVLSAAVLSAALCFTACGNAASAPQTAAAPTAAEKSSVPAETTGGPDAPEGKGSAPGGMHSGPEEGGITVSASASVTITPDKASVSLGVTNQGTAAERVQSDNAAAVNAVIAVLKNAGIAETSIKTSNFNLWPEHDYSDGKNTITGYSASTTLSVSDLEISKVGGIIADCVGAGANDVDNISYYCSTYDTAYEEALTKAVEAAQAKADALAKAAGRELGQAVTINEGWQNTSARYAKSANMDTMALAAAPENAMDVMPGETEIEAQVTVIYSFR